MTRDARLWGWETSACGERRGMSVSVAHMKWNMRVIAVENRKLSWILIDKEKRETLTWSHEGGIYSGFCWQGNRESRVAFNFTSSVLDRRHSKSSHRQTLEIVTRAKPVRALCIEVYTELLQHETFSTGGNGSFSRPAEVNPPQIWSHVAYNPELSACSFWSSNTELWLILIASITREGLQEIITYLISKRSI